MIFKEDVCVYGLGIRAHQDVRQVSIGPCQVAYFGLHELAGWKLDRGMASGQCNS